MQNWIDLLSPAMKEMLCRPLLIRALTTQTDPGFLTDGLAVRLCDRLGILTAKTKTPLSRSEMHRVIARTVFIDSLLQKQLQNRPDLVIVNLGAALDTRFSRVDNGRLRWYDIDLADVIHLRKTLIPGHERVTGIGLPVCDEAWPVLIEYEEPKQLVFIADGLLRTLQKSEVRRLLDRVATAFPDALLFCDVESPAARRQRQSAPVAFSLKKVSDISSVERRVSVENAWATGGLYPEKQSAGTRLLNRLPACRNRNRILQLRFNAAQTDTRPGPADSDSRGIAYRSQ